jgi:ribonucleotide monophosphatase NagD (HAD superfamily)
MTFEPVSKLDGHVAVITGGKGAIGWATAKRLAALGARRDPQILCIGDGIATDVQGGMAEGLDTLFVTGGICAAEFGPDLAHPDKALLEAFLTEKQLSATYSIATLR